MNLSDGTTGALTAVSGSPFRAGNYPAGVAVTPDGAHLYVANEGRFVAVVDNDCAQAALTALRAHPQGADAAIIGRVTAEPPGIVQLKTAFGGTRIVDLLVGDPLPRIC